MPLRLSTTLILLLLAACASQPIEPRPVYCDDATVSKAAGKNRWSECEVR